MAVEHRARKILERHKHLKQEKAPWLPLFEMLGRYVFTRKQHFTSVGRPGENQTAHLFDDTAVGANTLMAAALLGAQWPNGAKSVRIGLPFDIADMISDATGHEQNDTEEIKKFFEWQTKRLAYYMDKPRAGLRTALEECELDLGAFGISGVLVEERDDLDDPLYYRGVDAKAMYIAEGADGFVNTIHIEREYTVRQIVELYGYEALAAKHKKEFDEGKCTSKVQVVQCISPRLEYDKYGYGTKNMPIASIHIDIKEEKILKESGYEEMPAAISRFWKALGEVYGRSPGMNALASILEANVIGEAWSLFIEKSADPPLRVLDDGSNGNGIIDDSPGGVTVISVQNGRLGNQEPIAKLYEQGDLQWTASRRAELEEKIKNHFFQDRLMDLNNEQRMTLGEANIRNELRGQTLNTVYSRQMAELFTPIVERSYNILWRKGLLGVVKGSALDIKMMKQGRQPKYVPDIIAQKIANGEEGYQIEFISPAMRIMQAEELQGIEHTLQVASELARSGAPQVMDIPDLDYTLKRIQELSGAPSEMINSMETVKKIRKAREEQQQAMMQAEKDRQDSETARNVGQAAVSMTGAEHQAG